QQLQAEMARQLSLLQSDLDQKRKAQEDALALKKSKMIEEIRALADEEKKNIIKTAEKAVLGTMTKVILHIVSNKVPANVVQESVSDAWKHYQQ
ncbi:MAG: hypothetical protein Q8P95_02030, partial [bacterium]|nr:hypothetical protein [bacterium]